MSKNVFLQSCFLRILLIFFGRKDKKKELSMQIIEK